MDMLRLAGVQVPRIGLGTNRAEGRGHRGRAEPLQPHGARVDEVIDPASGKASPSCPTPRCAATAGRGVTPAARRLGVTENAVKLAWLLRRSPIVLPIPGTL